MKFRTKQIALATILGVLIFFSKSIFPSPIDKVLLVFQATLLALGNLLMKKIGATYVGSISGVLTAFWRTEYAPFTFTFALLYGFLVDVSFSLAKIDADQNQIETYRVVVAMAISTTMLGLLSYYTTVFLFNLLERNLILEFSLLFVGILNGIIAGFLTIFIWKKYLKNIRF